MSDSGEDARGRRDVITIGGSAGGFDALRSVLGALDPSLPASVLIVLHIPSDSRSDMAASLQRFTELPVRSAEDGAPLEHGCGYVAPPDMHMLVEENAVVLRRGPRENRCRPAIDPLFRSAASCCDSRVIGALLSGYLSDGTAGLRAIQRCGGLTVVQDPEDARVADMPRHALEHLSADYIAPADRIGTLLKQLAGQPAQRIRSVPPDVALEARMAAGESLSITNENALGRPSPIACPECNGNLWEIDDGGLLRYRCHIGHAYTAETVAQSQGEELDTALWSALRVMREQAALLRRMANRDSGMSEAVARRYEERAGELETQANTLHAFIGGALAPHSTADLRMEAAE